MIPLVHDLADETVVVFGGGPVGARKARRFAREAAVVVVSPAFVDEPFGGADRVRAAVDPTDVGDWLDRLEPALVVAGTDDPAVNEAIEAAALDRRILVNRADRAGARPAGSVIVPATVREGPVLAAVSTEGTAPTLSRALRVRLEAELAGAGRVANAIDAVAERLRAEAVEPAAERAAVRAVAASDAVWAAARDDRAEVDAVAAAVAEEALEDRPAS